MNIITSSLIALLAFVSLAYAQDDKVISTNPEAKYTSKAPSMEDYLFNQTPKDYKIIASNSSYIEIEYVPYGLSSKEISFNGEKLSVYEFMGGLSRDMKASGSPDLRFRSFGVMLPSEMNNSVQVTDYDVKEIQNVNIAPLPQVYFPNPNVRSFENVLYSYNKNADYSQNKYFPENPALLTNEGMLRDLTSASLAVYPCQYNPVTRSLRVYTRIRVRVSFGEAPVMLNRPRSREEIALLTGAALNSDLAVNWVNPRYRDNYKSRLVSNSVLASGDWYKIEIKESTETGNSEGIYKITKSFLDGAGINLAGVDARNIKVYGNGGDLLPDALYDPRPSDLEEMAVYFEGEADGSFDANDYILFYGKAINNWRYDTTFASYFHYINYHSRSNYYWICLNTSNTGKRMQFVPSGNNAAIYPTSFTEKIFQEPEQTNLINEGNLWLSARKSPGGSFEWNTSLTGLEDGSDIFYRVKMAARCLDNPSNYLIKDDHSTMSELFMSMPQVTGGFGDWISTVSINFTVNQSQKTNGEQVKLRATYYAAIGEAEAYQDWFEILYKRRFNSAQNDVLRFDSPDTTANVEYNVSSFSNDNIKVFDATEHGNVKIIQPINTSASNVKFQKNETKNHVSKFLVVGQNGYKTPTGISSRIPNQNIKGSLADGADFIIITHRDFMQAAERLKSKREQGGPSDPNYLKTVIVTTDQIFNEFSGGVYDAVAVRDFIKYTFDNWTKKPSHVCFMGDGNLDYKNILGYASNNWAPVWELTSPTINQVAGFTSDDYFVHISGGNGFPDKPDLSVGRIPANSLQECNDYLDKLDAYENGANNGYWKNRMLFVADDEKTSEGCENVGHLPQIESLAEQFVPAYIDKIKTYLITYPTVITPQGRRKPQVNSDIAKYWSEGMLNIHYTGHGSPDVWAHEYVLEKDNIISQISNENRYPFVSIASCDMSKFDNPVNRSAGELFMITGKKGAIGTLAATRPVYATGNAFLMYEVFNQLYIPRDTLLLQRRFGTAMFNTKNIIGYTENDAKYVLMCDPTLRTQMPRFRSHIDSISGLSGDTMKALSRIKIYGSILHPDSSKWTDYNGKIVLKIYDVDRQVSIFDECVPQGNPHVFRLNGGIIYSGVQNIVNGRWVVEYIVPKDISYLNQAGRLINYFYNNQYDGAGINRNFIVGGINPTAEIDTTGPRISMYLNNRNFRSGDLVSENSKFIADLFDESGINTTGTIGHKLEAVLDGNENNKYDLTNFYNSDTSYKSGTIEYDFTALALGSHTLKLKVWDTYNNSSEAVIDFNVTSSGTVQVTNVYNYPNPFKDNTAFTFHHNYPGNVNVKIKVYTVAGRLIKELEQNEVVDKFVMINWDGKDQDGETLGNGIYIYKLMVESADGTSVTNVGKLAVLK